VWRGVAWRGGSRSLCRPFGRNLTVVGYDREYEGLSAGRKYDR
jgi:hypothetical protein